MSKFKEFIAGAPKAVNTSTAALGISDLEAIIHRTDAQNERLIGLYYCSKDKAQQLIGFRLANELHKSGLATPRIKYHLACYYLFSIADVEEDYVLAKLLLLESGELDNSEDLLYVNALLRLYEIEVDESSDDEDISDTEESDDNGLRDNAIEQAFATIKYLAEDDYQAAQFTLGQCYLFGWGVAQNYAAAMNIFFEHCHEQKNSEYYRCALALYYATKPDGAQDERALAFNMLKELYPLDICADVTYELARCYYYGVGGEANTDYAIELLLSIINTDNTSAKIFLDEIRETLNSKIRQCIIRNDPSFFSRYTFVYMSDVYEAALRNSDGLSVKKYQKFLAQLFFSNPLLHVHLTKNTDMDQLTSSFVNIFFSLRRVYRAWHSGKGYDQNIYSLLMWRLKTYVQSAGEDLLLNLLTWLDRFESSCDPYYRFYRGVLFDIVSGYNISDNKVFQEIEYVFPGAAKYSGDQHTTYQSPQFGLRLTTAGLQQHSAQQCNVLSPKADPTSVVRTSISRPNRPGSSGQS